MISLPHVWIQALFVAWVLGTPARGNEIGKRSLRKAGTRRVIETNDNDNEEKAKYQTLKLFAPNTSFVVGLNSLTIMRPEGPRDFLLKIPKEIPEPPALILDFHSFFTNQYDQLRKSGIGYDINNPDRSFIVAFPRGIVGGLQNAFSFGPCCGKFAKAVDDVGFVRAIIEEIKLNMRINPRKIYATGYSQGGGMAIYLGIKIPEYIAAVSSNAFSLNEDYYPLALEAKQNNPNYHPMPFLGIHGYTDKFYCWSKPFCFGKLLDVRHNGPYTNAQLDWHRYAELNNCSGDPVTIAENDSTFWSPFFWDRSHTEYKWIKAYESCEDGVEVRQVLNSNNHGGEGVFVLGRFGSEEQNLQAPRVVEFFLRFSIPDYINVTVPDWWSNPF